MKKNLRNMFFGVVGLMLLAVVGCNASIPNHDLESSEKLAQNSVLKRGWVDVPIPMHISESFPGEFKDSMIDAMELWNLEAGVTLFEYAGETETETRDYDTINAIYWDDSIHPDGYYAEAHTQFINDTVIIEGDVVFYGDPETFEILSCEDGSEVCVTKIKKKDVVTTALHELGHILGFVHTEGITDIMNPEFYPGEIHRAFDDNLVTELLGVYNPIMLAEGE